MARALRKLPILLLLVAFAAPAARAVDPNFRIYADEFPLVPLSRLIAALNTGPMAISGLTTPSYASAAALELGTVWDFSAVTGSNRVLQVAPVDSAWTCYVPESANIPDRPCGFDRPENDILLVQDDLVTGARDTLAIDYDGVGTYFLRAWAVDQGNTPATGDEELRLCFWPDGDRKEVPFVVFGEDDAGRRFLSGSSPSWGSALFNCSASGSPIGVTQGAPCGSSGGLNAVLTDGDGTNGRVTGKVTSAGTLTLPSGHVLDALLVEILASFRAVLNPFCIPTGQRNRQYLLVWLVPEYGPLIQLRSDSDQAPDLNAWTDLTSTVIGYGLLPPLSIQVDSVGSSSLTVSWDPGPLTDFIDGYEVHWGTVSGHDLAPPGASGALDAALGTSYTITGLLPETTYFVSVSSLKTYTDPSMGLVNTYQSLVLPKSIGADIDGDGARDTSYPPETMATTVAGGAASLAVNRQVFLGPGGALPPVADQFAPGCQVPPHRLCADELVPGSLTGLVLNGEAAASGLSSLRLYEHSDPFPTMQLWRVGGDLYFAPN